MTGVPRSSPSADLDEAVKRPEVDTATHPAGRVMEVDLDRAVSNGTTSPSAVASNKRLRLASTMFAQGRIDEAREQAVTVLATPKLPVGLYSSARVAELDTLMAQDDWTGGRQAAEAILAGGHPDEDAALGGALAALGWVAWREGRARDAIGMLRAAVQRSDLGCVEGGVGHPRLQLAQMLTAVGDFSSASAVLGRYQADLETSTDPLRAARTRVARADLHLAAGHIDDAATEAEGARGAFETFGASLFTAGAEFTLARAELVRGDVDRASAHLVGMKAALRDGGATSRANASCAWLEAQLVGERDGPAATVQSVAWLYDSLSDHKPLLMSESHAAVWLVRTAQDAGDVRRAEKVIAFSDALAADNPDVEQLAAIACHARGLLDLDDDKLRCAASGYRWPWSAASASEDTGLALGRRDPGAARLWFERALRGFEAIGATGDAKRVRQRLQRIGRRRSRRVERKVSGWASLTETEQEVVGYVADGMTNRQVAARMYLSRHTVDFHLRGIFRKLAVGSRVELTRLVLQRSAMVDGGA